MQCYRCKCATRVISTRRDIHRRRECLNPVPHGPRGKPFRFSTREISAERLEHLNKLEALFGQVCQEMRGQV